MARTDCTCATVPTRLYVQIVLLGLRDQNLRLLRQARHVREPHPSTARTPARGPPSFSSGGPACKCNTSALGVLGARLRRDCDSLRVLIICVKLLGAACFFIFLQSLSCPPSPMPGIQAHNSACCSGRISCPWLSQGQWHRRALREDHGYFGTLSLCQRTAGLRGRASLFAKATGPSLPPPSAADQQASQSSPHP